MKRFFRLLLLGFTGCLATGIGTLATADTPFVGEIRWVGFNFAPRGWAFCDGQLLAVSQNDALFSLLGTIYGGDGRTTFALPDLRGRAPVHMGSGPGLTPRNIGAKGGQENVTPSSTQLPAHTHTLKASSESASNSTAAGAILASKRRTRVYTQGTANSDMHPTALGSTGIGEAHNNMPPYKTLNCIIALTGIYPSRN